MYLNKNNKIKNIYNLWTKTKQTKIKEIKTKNKTEIKLNTKLLYNLNII